MRCDNDKHTMLWKPVERIRKDPGKWNQKGFLEKAMPVLNPEWFIGIRQKKKKGENVFTGRGFENIQWPETRAILEKEVI